MSVSDVDRFRKEAEEARRQAERAINSLTRKSGCGSPLNGSSWRRMPRKGESKTKFQTETLPSPRLRGPPVHAGRILLRWVQIALKPASKALGLHGVFIATRFSSS